MHRAPAAAAKASLYNVTVSLFTPLPGVGASAFILYIATQRHGDLTNKLMASSTDILADITEKDYEFGFVTDIEMDIAPAGLSEETIRYISSKKMSLDGCLIGA